MNPRSSARKPGIRWLRFFLVFAWMGMIFYSSSQPYHKQNLQPEIHRWLPDQVVENHFSEIRFSYAGKEISVDALGAPAFVEFFIRKGAHFGAYAGLALLLSWAIAPLVRSRFVLLLLPVAVGLAYAASDEIHQYFTGDRTPLVQDVLIDGTGALAGVLLYTLGSIIAQARRRRRTAR
ncbi:VanZ family protein [Gorillibacterium sp. CAU 1737]|uniref:VanZ family protein n=1 Tax=Gorillibacterium sp. CAU 1737 TaxID=3140362 RepID=UPI0032608164